LEATDETAKPAGATMSERSTDCVVRVGDTMRWSVDLIEVVRAQTPRDTQIVVVDRIELNPDGTKTVWMSKPPQERRS
jgi:hypothetical protein